MRTSHKLMFATTDCSTQLEFCRHGDTFDQTVHPQGTEIKAITYSNMQIHEKPERADLYVIVDI